MLTEILRCRLQPQAKHTRKTKLHKSNNSIQKKIEQFKHETIKHVHNKQLYAASKKKSNTITTNIYMHPQKVNELQEQINKLKHQQIANEQPRKTETKPQTYHKRSQKHKNDLYDKQRPARKHQLNRGVTRI